MSISLQRIYRFSASHLYRRPEWSAAENFERFGKCSWEPGHGHNYRLTLTVSGAVDPVTGFVVDLELLDRVVRERILDRVDHRHLNDAVPEFQLGRRIPSSENLALWTRDQLVAALPSGCQLQSVRVAEDDELAAEWRADPGGT